MKRFEFKETEIAYQLLFNGAIIRQYLKRLNSRQDAEDKAAVEVKKAEKKYGYKNVEYNGCYAV